MVAIPYGMIDRVPVTIAAILCTLAVLTWLVILVFRHCHQKCGMDNGSDTVSTEEALGGVRYAANKCYAHRISFRRRRHIIVRTIVPILKKGPDDGPYYQQTILMKHVVPDFYIEQLLLFCFILLALTSQVFVSSYLLIKSYDCSNEPYVHCFEAQTHFLVVSDEELDCKNSTSLENVTSIICYDLTLNFPRAIGDAGSTLAGGAIYFGLITWTLLKLSGQKCWKKTKNGEISLTKKVAITVIQVAIMLVAFAIVQARVVALVIDQDTVYEDIIYLLIYNYVVLIGGIIPWSHFKHLERPGAEETPSHNGSISGEEARTDNSVDMSNNQRLLSQKPEYMPVKKVVAIRSMPVITDIT